MPSDVGGHDMLDLTPILPLSLILKGGAVVLPHDHMDKASVERG